MTEVPPPTRRSRKATDDATELVRAPAAPAAPDATGVSAPVSPAASGGDEPGRLPTAQLEMAAFGDHVVPWVPPEPVTPPALAPWALGLAIIALVGSFFVGVLLPLGAIATVVAILSMRRAHESRSVAVWAFALALTSVLFSAGWLLWALPQLLPA